MYDINLKTLQAVNLSNHKLGAFGGSEGGTKIAFFRRRIQTILSIRFDGQTMEIEEQMKK